MVPTPLKNMSSSDWIHGSSHHQSQSSGRDDHRAPHAMIPQLEVTGFGLGGVTTGLWRNGPRGDPWLDVVCNRKTGFFSGKNSYQLVGWLIGWLVGYCNISKCDGDGENNSSGQKNDRKTCHRCTTSSNFTFTFYDCQQLKVPWIIMNLLFFQSPSIDQICWWLAKCCRVGGQPGV